LGVGRAQGAVRWRGEAVRGDPVGVEEGGVRWMMWRRGGSSGRVPHWL